MDNEVFQIPVRLGVGSDGKEMTVNLLDAPNMLVVGSHGSGKDRFIEQVVESVLASGGSEDVKVVLANLGGCSFDRFEGDPHLLTTSVLRREIEAFGVMDYLTEEGRLRTAMFSTVKVNKISQYNAMVSEGPYVGAREKLPHLVYIIDEIAGMAHNNRPRFNLQLMRLSWQSRSLGIHLVFATEVINSVVITDRLLNDFPTHIAFRLDTADQSRLVLGQDGAETLGEGEAMFLQRGKAQLVRVRDYLHSCSIIA